MIKSNNRKKELDKQRTEWRKQHRTLNGRIILYPEKPPEHINARGSKVYNWFWRKILLEIEPQDIPAVISAIRNQIKTEQDIKKIRIYRTMIGMAEDAYQLKRLEDIRDYDTELRLGKKPIYDSARNCHTLKYGSVFSNSGNRRVQTFNPTFRTSDNRGFNILSSGGEGRITCWQDLLWCWG